MNSYAHVCPLLSACPSALLSRSIVILRALCFTLRKDFRDHLVLPWHMVFFWWYSLGNLLVQYNRLLFLFFLSLAQDSHFKLPLFWQPTHTHTHTRLHPWLLKTHRFVPDLLVPSEAKTGSSTRLILCTCIATGSRETSVSGVGSLPRPGPDFQLRNYFRETRVIWTMASLPLLYLYKWIPEMKQCNLENKLWLKTDKLQGTIIYHRPWQDQMT